MAGQIQDADWTVATQDGAKKLSLPLQEQADYYCTATDRKYCALASYYDPIIEVRTSYANLLTYSDDFSNAAWVKVAATATAASTDPEGGATATKLVETAANSAHNASQAVTVASGALSYGVLVSAAERSFVRLRINNATDGDVAKAVFNLTTGVVLSGTGTIKKLLNGWYWCYISGTATVANSSAFVDLTSDGSTFSYAGTAGSGIYLFHATLITTIPTLPWPAILTTSATRSVTAPPVDPDDPIQFLVQEDAPSDNELEFGIARWVRKYARISIGTTLGGSASVAQPNIPGTTRSFTTYTANTGVVQNTNGTIFATGGIDYSTTYFGDFSSGITYGIYGQIVTLSSSVQISATSGTFTLTYKSSTTAALNWNASGATVAAAVNGLASIIADGITVTCVQQLNLTSGNLSLTATAGTWLASMSMNSAGLGPTNAQVNDMAWNSDNATIQAFYLRRSCTSAAHGLTIGAAIVFYDSSDATWVKVPNGSWSVPDANTILLPGNAYGVGNVTKVAKYVKDYTPGTAIIRATITTNFYLPGFSPGVPNLAAIPVPTFQGSGSAFLNTVFANTGTINYIVGNLVPWNEPIYQISKTTINASDVM